MHGLLHPPSLLPMERGGERIKQRIPRLPKRSEERSSVTPRLPLVTVAPPSLRPPPPRLAEVRWDDRYVPTWTIFLMKRSCNQPVMTSCPLWHWLGRLNQTWSHYLLLLAHLKAKYRQEGLLNKGGFGTVYFGHRKSDNLPVRLTHATLYLRIPSLTRITD